MTKHEIVVRVTTDYTIFKRTANRKIYQSHVEKLMSSYKDDSLSMRSSPIVVSRGHHVIDGQHRLQAAKNLKMPVYYIIDDTITTMDQVLQQIVLRNVQQKKWAIIDYVQFYAAQGMEEYIFLDDIIETYGPCFSISAVFHLCQLDFKGFREGRSNEILRAGRIKIKNKDQIQKFIQIFHCDIMGKQLPSHEKTLLCSRNYMKALMILMENPKHRLTYELFMKKIEKNAHMVRNVSNDLEAQNCIKEICRRRDRIDKE
jgi:hypothetical protein